MQSLTLGRALASDRSGKKARLKNSKGHFLKLGELEANSGVLSLDLGGSWRKLTEQLMFSVGDRLTCV